MISRVFLRTPLIPLLTSGLALFAGIGMMGCSRNTTQVVEQPATVLVQAASASRKLPATVWSGSVRSHHQTKLAFSVAGRLKGVYAEVGDEVEAGTILAELDQEPFALGLAQAEAELQAAGPQLEEATKRRVSEERLWAENATSRTEYDAALSAHAAASARVKTAESAVSLAKRQVKETRLMAPCSGRIAQRLGQTASWCEVGATIFDFDPHGDPEVSLVLPSASLSTLRVGHSVSVSVADASAQLRILIGEISNISQRSLAGGMHEVIVRLPVDAHVFPGESVSVSLSATDEENQSPLLPTTALIPSAQPGKGHVFVYDPSGNKVQQRPVVYNQLFGSGVLIEQGLAPGELVVVAGASFMRDGQKVLIQVRN